MSKAFYFILALAIAGGSLAITNPFDLPIVFAQVNNNQITSELFIPELPNYVSNNQFSSTQLINENEYFFTSHYKYFEDYENHFIPYRLTQNENMVQLEIADGKIVFDKTTAGVTYYKNNEQVIKSDSYIVRGAELDTDNWVRLDVNDSPIETIIESDGFENVIITFRKQNDEGIFDIEFKFQGSIKTTAKFTNLIYPNHKFAFTQTVQLNDPIITLNDSEIDLTQYVNQSFPKEVLEQNEDLIIEAKRIFYNSGLGFENLWSVGIFDDNKIALDYAKVEQTQTEIGQTVELDPSINITETNANSGVIQRNTGSNPGYSDSAHCTGSNYVDQRSSSSHFVGIGYSYCNRAILEFDISSIPDGATITNVQGYSNNFYKYYHGSAGCEYYTIESNTLSTDSISTIWSDIENGSLLYQTTNDGACVTETGSGYGNRYVTVTQNFGSNGITDLQNELAVDNSWSVGMKGYLNGDGGGSVTSPSVIHGFDPHQTDGYQLQVTYTLSPPSNPTGLTITQDTAGELDLSWTQTGIVTGFKIERSLDNSSWTTLTSNTGTTATTYTDTGLNPNTLYYYRVFAYNVSVPAYSTGSTSSSQTTWDYPGQVTGLSATAGNPISLSWSVPASDDTIINYKVYRDTVFLKTVAGTSTTDTPPSFGTSYSYTVSAVSSVGEGAQSASSSATYGTPPDPPTSVTTSITNVNTNPLDVLVSYSSPTYVGSGTLTGFEIVRDGSVVATVGLVTSYTDTVPSAGTYTYLVRAIATHGTSSDSNTSNITTPNEPSAINNLSATVNSDTAIALSWSSPNNGGSSITLYKVFQDAVQIDTTTNTSYTVTGLTPNTSYDFTVVASNNVGDSTASNTATETTYLEITGQIDLTATTQGSTTQFVFSANVTAGTPTPTFSTFDILKNGVTIASNISSPYNLKLTDTASNTYTIISTDNTHWNTPSINGTVSGITASYQADWQTDLLGSNEIAYNLSRANDQLNLVVNRDTGTNTWHLNCNYRTNTQILAGNNGTWYEVNSWYYNNTQSISDASIVYIDCYNDDVILQITSYSSDRTGGGIAVLNGFFEDWTGTPVALFFVLLVAGLFSGRTAPTGILLMLAIVGVMGFVGLLVIDEVVWAFILLVGVLGLFVGKRFL